MHDACLKTATHPQLSHQNVLSLRRAALTSSSSCRRKRPHAASPLFPCGICTQCAPAHRKTLQGEAERGPLALLGLIRGPADRRALHSALDFAPPCRKAYDPLTVRLLKSTAGGRSSLSIASKPRRSLPGTPPWPRSAAPSASHSSRPPTLGRPCSPLCTMKRRRGMLRHVEASTGQQPVPLFGGLEAHLSRRAAVMRV